MPVTVTYEVQYEACALLFLAAVAVRFFSVRRFPNMPNRLFGIVLVCALADLVLDIVGSYTIMAAATVPVWVNYLINTVFYMLQIIFPALMASYVIYCTGKRYLSDKRLLLLLIPTAVFIVALLLNPITQHIFFVPEIGGARVYCRGPAFSLMYLVPAFYMILTLILVYVYRARLDKRQRSTVVRFIVILAASILSQYFFPAVLLTGVAMSLAILMMFFTLQNPDDMLDFVSHVFNYNAMTDFLGDLIGRGEPFSVVIVDMGGIRRINSSFGLIVGNRIFALVGDFLNRLRGQKWVFRIVGTRFMVVTTDEKDHIAAVDAIRSRFEQDWNVDGNAIRLNATIRYFASQRIFESAEEVVSLIDETYAGINSGNWGQCRQIDREALELSHRKTLIESEMRAALRDGGGFSLRFQPILDTHTNRFTCAEALLRFDSAKLGRISPSEFIPIAEKNGSIFQIDDCVVRMACEYLARDDTLKYLEVNLSASEFFCNPMPRIHAIVAQCGIDPRRICFEVTETAADVYPAMLAEFMNGMIAYGYRFALDDFGTGYSNITKVASLPFFIVKIDRVLLSDEPKTRILFHSLTDMFARIGIATVVEGVETEEQARRVCPHVDYAQGFLYAGPMREADLHAFLRERA